MGQRRLLAAFLATSAALAALFGAALLLRPGVTGTDTDEGVLLADPWPAPPLRLGRTDGSPFDLEALRGRHVAVFFGYTFCPDVCPITLAQLARLAGEFDPGATRLALVFVSLDPPRDTPERLDRWTSAFDGRVVPLTGTLEALRTVAWDWGIGFRYRTIAAQPDVGVVSDDPPPADVPYLVDHTARTFLVDPDGRVVAQIAPENEGAELRAALGALLGR